MDYELFRRTRSWAEEIVWKDPVFQDYAGAPWDIGDQMATIDVLLEYLVANPQARLILKLVRTFLLQKKKAFYAGVKADPIATLAFLKGGKMPVIDAILNPKSKSETE